MNTSISAIVWTIAGSDCTGGAGIQADIKTLHNLAVEACSVITAVTAQNSDGVQEINAVSEAVLSSQLQSLEAEKTPAVIKVGMLANDAQIYLVADYIRKAKQSWPIPPIIVYDPVMVASSGGLLTEDDILPLIKSELLPLVDVLTPNIPELQKLTGVYPFSWGCFQAAAKQLIKAGVKKVIIKGGHFDLVDTHSVDYCLEGENEYWLASPVIETRHTHGTGCTFASAIAALLARGYQLRDAFTIAKATINQGLQQARYYPGKRGAVWQGLFPTELSVFPTVVVPGSPLSEQLQLLDEAPQATDFASEFACSDTHNLGLYPVVDSLEWLERLLKSGVKTIQYRDKQLTDSALDDAIKAAAALGRQFRARLFINDHWQLAIKHGAYGVHLGQEDLQRADLVAVKQAGLRLGVSTHGHYELLKAKQYAPSYIAVGAIFPTRTKDMSGQIQGLETLRQLVLLNSEYPMVAIGGIDLTRAPGVLQTGVGSIAVVTAITLADDPEQVVSRFQALMS